MGKNGLTALEKLLSHGRVVDLSAIEPEYWRAFWLGDVVHAILVIRSWCCVRSSGILTGPRPHASITVPVHTVQVTVKRRSCSRFAKKGLGVQGSGCAQQVFPAFHELFPALHCARMVTVGVGLIPDSDLCTCKPSGDRIGLRLFAGGWGLGGDSPMPP